MANDEKAHQKNIILFAINKYLRCVWIKRFVEGFMKGNKKIILLSKEAKFLPFLARNNFRDLMEDFTVAWFNITYCTGSILKTYLLNLFNYFSYNNKYMVWPHLTKSWSSSTS